MCRPRHERTDLEPHAVARMLAVNDNFGRIAGESAQGQWVCIVDVQVLVVGAGLDENVVGPRADILIRRIDGPLYRCERLAGRTGIRVIAARGVDKQRG